MAGRAARRAGLSPAAFSRYFRQKMGHTFEDFVNEIRVGRSCRALIETPEKSVAEIAHAKGAMVVVDNVFATPVYTRAISLGEDFRAGRWWWENGKKECGLHIASSLNK